MRTNEEHGVNGTLMGRGRASQLRLALIRAGRIRSLFRRPSALVRTGGSGKPCASTCLCASGITASSTKTSSDRVLLCGSGAPDKFRVRFGGERFDPKDRDRGIASSICPDLICGNDTCILKQGPDGIPVAEWRICAARQVLRSTICCRTRCGV